MSILEGLMAGWKEHIWSPLVKLTIDIGGYSSCDCSKINPLSLAIIIEQLSKAYTSRVKGCPYYFHDLGQLKEHQITQHHQFPCAYANCPISCGRKYNLDRHHKSQHKSGKKYCTNGCGYVQRPDKMQKHLKDCHFGEGIFFIHSQ